MHATMGYIAFDITYELLGYLSTTMGIKHTSLLNGVVASSKVQTAGRARIFIFGALCRSSWDS